MHSSTAKLRVLNSVCMKGIVGLTFFSLSLILKKIPHNYDNTYYNNTQSVSMCSELSQHFFIGQADLSHGECSSAVDVPS